AVEQHDLSGRGQMRDIALEVPLRLLSLARCRHGDDAADARVEVPHDPLDHAILSGRVAALEQHHETSAGGGDPLLDVDELGLQAQELLLVLLDAEFGGRVHRDSIIPSPLTPLPRAVAWSPTDLPRAGAAAGPSGAD